MKMKPKPGPQPDGGYVLDCSHKIDYGAHPMPKKASKSKLRHTAPSSSSAAA